MTHILDPSVELRRNDDVITLRRRSWPENYPIYDVHPVCAVILALFDGRRTADDVTDTIAQVFSFSPQAAAKATKITLRKYERFLSDSERLGGREAVLYDPVQFVIPPKPLPLLKQRETVPQYIIWRVTRYCNRRCKYCCVAARHAEQPPDTSLTFERAREIFIEGADIGVRGVGLTGGEPFIRSDMVDIMELIVKLGYEVQVDTKFALSDEQIGRLADAGLPLIDVSLDSPYAATANYLVGDDSYFDAITRSIRSLADHGIAVNVCSVLTERNVRELPELVPFLIELGAAENTFNTFSRHYGQCRYVKELELSDESKAWLRDTIPALQEKYAGQIRIAFNKDFDKEAAACTGRRNETALPLNCEQGIRVLRLLPDGRVTKCDQWWFEHEVVYGDLRTQSIYEAWSSPALLELLYPPRERFRGTTCESCDVFDTCSSTGRCLFASHEMWGSIYAPDNHCIRRSDA